MSEVSPTMSSLKYPHQMEFLPRQPYCLTHCLALWAIAPPTEAGTSIWLICLWFLGLSHNQCHNRGQYFVPKPDPQMGWETPGQHPCLPLRFCPLHTGTSLLLLPLAPTPSHDSIGSSANTASHVSAPYLYCLYWEHELIRGSIYPSSLVHSAPSHSAGPLH